MAILYFFIVTVGAIVVAAFEYENEVSLYKLLHMFGAIDVLRGNEFQSMEQHNLVPGDVVALKPGITYCDMVLINNLATIKVLTYVVTICYTYGRRID
jgi:magnesium-transporting ATPase (P-type)